ncbi:putative membrane protein YccC [Gracilibacillus halotolerans]|uniref:Putative membrane protein YccC n=1 Tax=Gracilibacillus halotolerans TaxID=74386 RepID=A0A841RNH1_9BACI|nr:putative membrane protein YccC [Gracilibacillus halotolerans]
MNGILFIGGMMLLFLLLIPVIILVLPLIGVKGFILVCIVLIICFLVEWIGKYYKISK